MQATRGPSGSEKAGGGVGAIGVWWRCEVQDGGSRGALKARVRAARNATWQRRRLDHLGVKRRKDYESLTWGHTRSIRHGVATRNLIGTRIRGRSREHGSEHLWRVTTGSTRALRQRRQLRRAKSWPL